ncbi:MAG TPA: hypothetical protein VFM25_01820, partial [Verrucomicrobiae bacterium]|nr:hypothetical protein [Verrucomicrobiae bacterium]
MPLTELDILELERNISGCHSSAITIKRAQLRANAFLQKPQEYIQHVQNANTISDDLKLAVVLQTVMGAFKRNILPLGAYSTRFDVGANLKRHGGLNKLEVPYYPLDTTASKDFSQDDGYVFDQSTNTSSKEVTINKRKYKPLGFTSEELARQPYLDVQRLAVRAGEQLAIDVVQDVFSIVTAANFGAPVLTEAADAFDIGDVAAIRTECNKSDWPKMGRSLLLDSDFEGHLHKDLLKVNEAGSDQPLREGIVGRLSGFDIYESPHIPDNGEFLVGFAAFMSAILFGSAPIQP